MSDRGFVTGTRGKTYVSKLEALLREYYRRDAKQMKKEGQTPMVNRSPCACGMCGELEDLEVV